MITQALDVQKIFRNIKLMRFCLIFIFMFTFIGGTFESYGQGSNPGRTNSKTTKRKAKKSVKQKSTRKSRKVRKSTRTKKNSRTKRNRSKSKRRRTNRTAKSKSRFAKLNIKINQPFSKVTIFNKNGESIKKDFGNSPSDGSPLVINNLRSGKYILVITKDGFIDEKREISIVAGRTNIISVNLSSAVAYLTIVSNVKRALITIENSETLERQEFSTLSNKIENIELPIGKYKAVITKDGYISQTKPIILNRKGQSNTLVLTLKPIPIEQLLSEAEIALSKNDYEATIEKSARILSIKENHPKANLLMGIGRYHNGIAGSEFYLLKALQLGENIILPVRVFKKNKGKYQLILGNLTINRSFIQFNNSYNPKLNFLLTKRETKKFQNSFDKHNVSFVSFEGKGLFNGKKRKRKVKIYSQNAIINSSRNAIFCSNCPQNQCVCDLEIGAIYGLLYGWKNKT